MTTSSITLDDGTRLTVRPIDMDDTDDAGQDEGAEHAEQGDAPSTARGLGGLLGGEARRALLYGP